MAIFTLPLALLILVSNTLAAQASNAGPGLPQTSQDFEHYEEGLSQLPESDTDDSEQLRYSENEEEECDSLEKFTEQVATMLEGDDSLEAAEALTEFLQSKDSEFSSIDKSEVLRGKVLDLLILRTDANSLSTRQKFGDVLKLASKKLLINNIITSKAWNAFEGVKVLGVKEVFEAVPACGWIPKTYSTDFLQVKLPMLALKPNFPAFARHFVAVLKEYLQIHSFDVPNDAIECFLKVPFLLGRLMIFDAFVSFRASFGNHLVAQMTEIRGQKMCLVTRRAYLDLLKKLAESDGINGKCKKRYTTLLAKGVLEIPEIRESVDLTTFMAAKVCEIDANGYVEENASRVIMNFFIQAVNKGRINVLEKCASDMETVFDHGIFFATDSAVCLLKRISDQNLALLSSHAIFKHLDNASQISVLDHLTFNYKSDINLTPNLSLMRKYFPHMKPSDSLDSIVVSFLEYTIDNPNIRVNLYVEAMLAVVQTLSIKTYEYILRKLCKHVVQHRDPVPFYTLIIFEYLVQTRPIPNDYKKPLYRLLIGWGRNQHIQRYLNYVSHDLSA